MKKKSKSKATYIPQIKKIKKDGTSLLLPPLQRKAEYFNDYPYFHEAILLDVTILDKHIDHHFYMNKCK